MLVEVSKVELLYDKTVKIFDMCSWILLFSASLVLVVLLPAALSKCV
jgi:hypothetical protein